MKAYSPAAASEAGDPIVSPLVIMSQISKQYPGVSALRDVSMELRRGEVHALVGENGAARSTPLLVWSGDVAPDERELLLDGQTVVFRSPLAARRRGIVTIFQELMIVPELSVAENIFLGNEPVGVGGLYSRRAAQRRTRDVLKALVRNSG